MSCLMLNFKVPKQIQFYFVLKDLQELVFLKNIHTNNYFYFAILGIKEVANSRLDTTVHISVPSINFCLLTKLSLMRYSFIPAEVLGIESTMKRVAAATQNIYR